MHRLPCLCLYLCKYILRTTLLYNYIIINRASLAGQLARHLTSLFPVSSLSHSFLSHLHIISSPLCKVLNWLLFPPSHLTVARPTHSQKARFKSTFCHLHVIGTSLSQTPTCGKPPRRPPFSPQIETQIPPQKFSKKSLPHAVASHDERNRRTHEHNAQQKQSPAQFPNPARTNPALRLKKDRDLARRSQLVLQYRQWDNYSPSRLKYQRTYGAIVEGNE